MERRSYQMNVNVETVFSSTVAPELREDLCRRLLFEALVKAEAAANQAAWVEKDNGTAHSDVALIARLHFSDPKPIAK